MNLFCSKDSFFLKQLTLFKLLCCFLIFFLISQKDLVKALSPKGLENFFAQGIVVDLRDPEFSDGILTTHRGGLITGNGLRLQASKITYTRQMRENSPVCKVAAEGNLLLEFDKYSFVGARLEYDFQTKTGILYEGRTAIEPWYSGGQVIYILPNKNYKIEQGFVTTSENCRNDWQIEAEEVLLTADYLFQAKQVKFRFLKLPVFYLPCFSINLNVILDTPLRYWIRWGGRQGTRFGLIYEVFSWKRLEIFLRLDYRLKRGLGAGLETYYRSDDHLEEFQTINYVARDSSLVHPHQRLRYRFQGLYNNLLDHERLSVNLSWDKLSDKDMPTDYEDRGLELDTAGRTQLHVCYRDQAWITNFYTRVRLNSFQTVKQELPTLQTQWLPLNLGKSGVISDSKAAAAYLDFKYSHGLEAVQDYHAGRLTLVQKFYRPYKLAIFTVTPQLEGRAIFYSNSPSRQEQWLALGKIGCDVNTRFYLQEGNQKHVIIPYLNYAYYTYPTSSPYEHYIFDIQDGWYRLNLLRFGVQQNFYYKAANNRITRLLYANVYANAFFDTKTIHATIPKLYGLFIVKTHPNLHSSLDMAWDLQRNKIDYANLRLGWTLSQDMAITAEYRHRDAYDWRKVDRDNFMLDSFRPVHQLLHSSLSDRRDTLLLHFFYRFHPNWAIEFESRQGWNRLTEPKYTEFEIDILATLRSAWHLKLYYRHRIDDDRFAINLTIGFSKPSCPEEKPTIYSLDF